jgi:hypothetical protein
MGNRGNIVMHYEDGNKIYFYSHWGGDQETLKAVITNALQRSKDRWEDEPYLSRIIFSEMIKNDINGTTGYGITPYITDGIATIVIDLKNQTVNDIDFKQFIAKT